MNLMSTTQLLGNVGEFVGSVELLILVLDPLVLVKNGLLGKALTNAWNVRFWP